MDSKYIVIGGVKPDNCRSLLRPFEGRIEEGIVLTREPGGTPLAEKLRSFLLDGEATDQRMAVSLIKAARVDHEERVIQPALKRGDSVICDSLDYSLLVPIVNVPEHEWSIMHRGFERKWLFEKPTLLILIMPPEECKLSTVVRNIGRAINGGISLHETEVVYVDPSDRVRMEQLVHETIAGHLKMISPV